MKQLPRLPLLAALCLLLAGCQQAYFRVMNTGVPDIPVTSEVFDDALRLSVDVYAPAAASSPAPVVVFIHGGTWRDGSRSDYRFVGEALARHGVLVLIPDYRKAPRHAFPAFMFDAATATAWARRNAARLGGDPARIFVMGHSSGGHMAALLATDARYLARWNMRPRDLAGAIGLAGVYDFLPITDRLVRQAFSDEAAWPSSQPGNFADGDEPPFLLLHGASDRRVHKGNSERFAAHLRRLGDSVQLRILPRTGHIALVNGFRSARFSPVLEETLPWIIARRAASDARAGASQ